MNARILITGSSGLVGSALAPLFAAQSIDVTRFDIHASGVDHGDVRHRERVAQAVHGAQGIVHLAAVSRVIWGERDPELCRSTNVDGLRNVLELAASSPLRPWVIFASSREVYGQPDGLPVSETCPVHAVNVYGHSKVEGERLVEMARRDGLRACTIRLSNVFGSTYDHADRVVPAFARAAAFGQTLRVDGPDHTFDFTHIDDVARGIIALAEMLKSGEAAPEPIHFVSGVPTTLGQLAALAIRIAGSGSTMREAPPRDFDVAKFYGSFARAKEVLGWEPRVLLEEGLSRLIRDFRNVQNVAQTQEITQ
jgi:nucleoside-diphosphate-sugar epimerase